MVEIVITGSINDALRASPAAKTCEDYENKKTQKVCFYAYGTIVLAMGLARRIKEEFQYLEMHSTREGGNHPF